VTGTLINVVAILLGGVAGLTLRRGIPPATQGWIKIALAVFTVFFGVRLTWISVNGSLWSILKQMLVVILALMLGKLTGQALRLQKTSNRLGHRARERMSAAKPGMPGRFGDGFTTCSLLFCVAPLAVLGAVSDGLSRYYSPLVIKAVMDGLATMGFVAVWGWGVTLAALPVLAWQGTISLIVMRFAEPLLREHGLVDSVNATAGLLVFCVGLLIFEARKIEVTNYLPSLLYAPLLAWWLL
jgi:hypothetical protein